MFRVRGVMFLLMAFGWLAVAQTSNPQIMLTKIPVRDAGGPARLGTIAGEVRNAPAKSRIVVFAHGDVWYVEPYTASPYTKLVDGKFETNTHLGTEYAVLLVDPSYTPPNKMADIPWKGEAILAVKIVPGL